MRIVAAVALVMATMNCSRPTTSTVADADACIDRLVAPYYPLIPESARLALEHVVVRVRLNPNGSVASFDVNVPKGSEEKAKLFRPTIEQAIRTSTFRPECQGREIDLAYDFQLAYDEKKNEGRISFQPPNRIEVVSRSAIVQ